MDNLTHSSNSNNLRDITLSAIVCGLTALCATPLLGRIDLANIVMVFLLVVVLLTMKLGKVAGVTAAFVSVALFDVFFVEPRFSFSVNDAQYLLTFLVMLLVALVISYFTNHLREQAEFEKTRAAQSHALYELARVLASCTSQTQLIEAVSRFMHNTLHLDTVLILPNADESLHAHSATQAHLSDVELLMAHATYESGQAMQMGHQNDGEHSSTHLPLQGSTRLRGVLVARSNIEKTDNLLHERPMLEAVASITAASIERLHFVAVAQTAEWQASSERLRSSILSALSHDIRTPLTALYGMADSLHLIEPPLPKEAINTADALCQQARQLNQMVSNLLDMAKLQAGGTTLRCEWQPIEEVVGTSLQILQPILKGHTVKVDLNENLPLLYFDAVLLERVFCNLIENAVKYGSGKDGINIKISAVFDQTNAIIGIENSGNAIDSDKLKRIFELFERAQTTANTAGTGIGLSICRSIIEAHAGRIWAENTSDGVIITFTLPLGTPPSVAL
jgi:two-component system, OmpR family, sensor histidine kinase KdpD